MNIGLICAIPEESEHILREMVIEKEVSKLKTNFFHGTYLDHRLTFVIGGIGKVSSALCTQVLIDFFDVDIVLFSGIAGGLRPDLQVGDTIIGVEVFYHDVDMAGQGILTNTITSIFRNRFKSDPKFINILKKQLKNKVYPMSKYLREVRDGKDITISFGRILTGDQVIVSKEKVTELYEKYNGDCVEMEGAAVAQTCVLHDRPFLIIRTISDLADEDAMVTALKSMDSVVEVNHMILKDIFQTLRDMES